MILAACEDKEDPLPETEEPIVQLPKAGEFIQFSSIRAHPSGTVELEFSVNCSKIDTNQFAIEWVVPPDVVNCRPYSFQIARDYQLLFRLIDIETKRTYNEDYTILIDTILDKYDYRNIYTGNYDLLVVSEKWGYYENSFDTLRCVGSIEKFIGYTAGSDSNYEDIDYKIGIRYSDYSQAWSDSRCGWTNYYTEGYLHPTIDLSGNLTYPEFESCEGRLTGHIRNDSLHIKYVWYNKWGGFDREITGFRTIESKNCIYVSTFIFL